MKSSSIDESEMALLFIYAPFQPVILTDQIVAIFNGILQLPISVLTSGKRIFIIYTTSYWKVFG